MVFVRRLRNDEHGRIIWTKKAEALLGTAPDPEIARALGLAVDSVRVARTRRGIPAYRRPARSKRKASGRSTRRKRPRRWTKKEIALLGTLTDVAVARKLGISSQLIYTKRRELGIPARPRKSPVRTWTGEEIALLGTVPGVAVAEKLGVTRTEIFRKRKELGIPLGQAPKSRRQWAPDEQALLGTMPDSELAAKLGITTAEVTWKRTILRIPRFRRDHWRKVDWRGALARLRQFDS